MAIGARLKHAWDAFSRTDTYTSELGRGGEYWSMGGRPDRSRPMVFNERSIISSIYTRLGIDVASVEMRHVRVDDEKRYLEDVDSGLNNCLTLEANIDQPARAFRQDIALTLFDRGVIAIVPVDTSISPLQNGGFDIKTLRVGHIMMWHPQHIRVSLYNEKTGKREELTLPKSMCAIIENPLYSVMNEPSSTLQRLIHKLTLLDSSDDQAASGKLDLLIQVPYVIKSETRRDQAEKRRRDIEMQLKGSQYGIAYTDATEKVIQLNRPAENNLMGQVEYLTNLLYVQLGLTPEVMNGTADEPAMLNYMNRTVEPICDSIVEAMRAKFLTKTARTQGQNVMYFNNRFKLIPIGGEGGIADIADKFTRNEIASSNEIRQLVGWKPSTEPKADQLVNSNMPQADTGVDSTTKTEDPKADEATNEAP